VEKVRVVFEDENILVLDKPAGLVVNRAKTVKRKTLQDWIEELPSYRAIKLSSQKRSPEFTRRSGIVHRLDKETSGLLVVAKDASSFVNLQQQFRERKVEKKYLALAHGRVEPSEGIVRQPISRSPFDRKKFGVFLGGREAETKYRVVAYLDQGAARPRLITHNPQLTLLELVPKTGRTHQIRVHLKYLGYPVVADQKYAGRKTARADRSWCPRQFLHACFLAFIHPQKAKKLKFTSPLPPRLQKVLGLFELTNAKNSERKS
jgi:23S rRNA pseudouridine1911/1915/1917 synthase